MFRHRFIQPRITHFDLSLPLPTPSEVVTAKPVLTEKTPSSSTSSSSKPRVIQSLVPAFASTIKLDDPGNGNEDEDVDENVRAMIMGERGVVSFSSSEEEEEEEGDSEDVNRFDDSEEEESEESEEGISPMEIEESGVVSFMDEDSTPEQDGASRF